MVKGSVTISIEDFQLMLDTTADAKELKEATYKASKEIQVFLSYLHAQLDLTVHIQSFNRQSTKSKIIIDDDNKIKIQFK